MRQRRRRSAASTTRPRGALELRAPIARREQPVDGGGVVPPSGAGTPPSRSTPASGIGIVDATHASTAARSLEAVDRDADRARLLTAVTPTARRERAARACVSRPVVCADGAVCGEAMGGCPAPPVDPEPTPGGGGCACQAAGAGASELPRAILVLLGLVVSLLRRRSAVARRWSCRTCSSFALGGCDRRRHTHGFSSRCTTSTGTAIRSAMCSSHNVSSCGRRSSSVAATRRTPSCSLASPLVPGLALAPALRRAVEAHAPERRAARSFIARAVSSIQRSGSVPR